MDCQRFVDDRSSAVYFVGMPQSESERRALGRRLAAARNLAGFTLESAAEALTERGHKIGKAAVGAWETGRNLPDALWLRRLAKLYGTTLDALVWENSVSMEAMQVAVEYDALNEQQKRTFRAVWTAFVTEAATDEKVGAALPLPPGSAADEDVLTRNRLPGGRPDHTTNVGRKAK